MGDFEGKKTRYLGYHDLNPGPAIAPTDEYVAWLEEQLASSRRTVSNLRKRLDQYTQAESRRMRHEQDYVPYADDDRYD